MIRFQVVSEGKQGYIVRFKDFLWKPSCSLASMQDWIEIESKDNEVSRVVVTKLDEKTGERL